MPYEATEISLSDIAFVNPSRQLRKGDLSPFIEMAALPLNSRDIDPNEITKRKFSGSGARFLNGDVLLARITPCLENGKTAYISTLDKEVVGHGSTEFIVLSPKQSQTDAHFLYYLARSPDFRQFAISRMEGTSGRQRVSASSIGSYRFICPQASIRAEIGQTLSALDDCIGLNNQSNKTLEAIAQALFKSWFIDFDPVKAKMAGRQPEAMEEATAVLFPAEFEESEIGLIPKDWWVKSVGDIFDLNPSYRLSKGSQAPYLDMANVPTSGFRAQQLVNRGFGSGTKFTNGDTLLARITPCLENGKTAYVNFLEENQVGWGSTEFIVMRPRQPLPLEFGYLFARYAPFRTYAIQRMSGTSGRQRVSADAIAGYQLAIPLDPIAHAFSESVGSLFKLIKSQDEQSKNLAKIRDSLLHKLMSGQLRIPDAESFCEPG